MKRAGFTLVEILVICVIVAILALVSIPLFKGPLNRAIASEAEAGIIRIYAAMRIQRQSTGEEYSAIDAGEIADTLVDINDGDLNGTYFSEDDYEVSIQGENAIIWVDSNDEFSGTVSLTIANDGTTTWTRDF